ncbi:MAG: CPBP family intramembrane metalloprotease [Rubrivivax sp.]|nr:CPBP family intramembrane metalloprotease [Rubrivivax sp.]
MIPASPWIALAALALLWLFSGPDPARRAWALAALATLALFLALRALSQVVPGGQWIGNNWDWRGPLLGLAGVLGVAALLVRKGMLEWRDAGITLAQARGSMPIALGITTVALGVNYALMSLSSFRLPGVQLETWLYQATLPGLVEETVFRGVLLALAERAVGAGHPHWDVMGARIGWGGMLVTLVFLALHGISLGTVLGVLPAALLYLWLRQRTGSLLLPIVAHNLWNLSVYAAHL